MCGGGQKMDIVKASIQDLPIVVKMKMEKLLLVAVR
jgi:hypothetical protein